MGKTIQEKICPKVNKAENGIVKFFEVIHDYRKIQVARYKRKQRNEKKKLIQKKMFEEMLIAEERRNQMLNHNMLAQQNVWEVLIDENEKISHSGDTQIMIEKPDRLAVAKQFILKLPVEPKTTIFPNDFTCFDCPKF